MCNVKKLIEDYRNQGKATHTIDEVPTDVRPQVQAKVDSGEIPHNPWPEAQFRAIMANTKDPKKRAEYAREQHHGK